MNRDEHGASAVEFALVLPFLCLILFGLITTGFTYNDHLSISNAAREGARFGSALDYTQAGWATSVRDRVEDVYFDGHPPNSPAEKTEQDSQICVKIVINTGTPAAPIIGTPSGSSGAWAGSRCGTAPDAPAKMATNSCAVMVWVRRPADIELLIAPTLNFNIGAKSVSYYGRTVGGCTAS